jgi:hypothetical protein
VGRVYYDPGRAVILFFDTSALICRFEGVPVFQSAAVALLAE